MKGFTKIEFCDIFVLSNINVSVFWVVAGVNRYAHPDLCFCNKNGDTVGPELPSFRNRDRSYRYLLYYIEVHP